MSSPSSNPNPASRRQPTTSPTTPTVPDEDHGVDLPLTMSASVVLTSLPKNATQALREAEAVDDRKGMYCVFFQKLPILHERIGVWPVTFR